MDAARERIEADEKYLGRNFIWFETDEAAMLVRHHMHVHGFESIYHCIESSDLRYLFDFDPDLLRDFLVLSSSASTFMIKHLSLKPSQSNLIEWQEMNPFLIASLEEIPLTLVFKAVQRDWRVITRLPASISSNPCIFGQALDGAAKDHREFGRHLYPNRMFDLSQAFADFYSSLDEPRKINIFIAVHTLPDFYSLLRMEDIHFCRAHNTYKFLMVAAKSSCSVLKKISLHNLEFMGRLFKFIFDFAEFDLCTAHHVASTPWFQEFMEKGRKWTNLAC